MRWHRQRNRKHEMGRCVRRGGVRVEILVRHVMEKIPFVAKERGARAVPIAIDVAAASVVGAVRFSSKMRRAAWAKFVLFEWNPRTGAR